MPGVIRPWTGTTPESISATPTPAPVYPACHRLVARMVAATLWSEYGSPDGS